MQLSYTLVSPVRKGNAMEYLIEELSLVVNGQKIEGTIVGPLKAEVSPTQDGWEIDALYIEQDCQRLKRNPYSASFAALQWREFRENPDNLERVKEWVRIDDKPEFSGLLISAQHHCRDTMPDELAQVVPSPPRPHDPMRI